MRTYAVYRTIAGMLGRLAAWITNVASVMQTRAERQLRMMRFVYCEEEHGQNGENENLTTGERNTEYGYRVTHNNGTKTTAE